MKCEECKYWEFSGFEPEENKAEEGFCHRHAPCIVEGMLISERDDTPEDEYGLPQYPDCWEAKHSVWPKTYEGEWCGEFEAKDKVTE